MVICMEQEIDIKKLKSIELQLMDEFISVCEKLKLNYYIIGGTLIGAVRHKGFIPWDDDIDVAMLREDYEIFLAKGQQLLSNSIFLQNFKTDPYYINCFSKLRMLNTAFVEKSVCKIPMNHGIYIDIFPLDYYFDKAANKLSFILKSRMIQARISLELQKSLDESSQSIKERLLKKAAKMLYPDTVDALYTYEDLIKCKQRSTLVRNYGGAYGKKEIFPIEWLGDGEKLKFEGRLVNAPCEWDKYLSHIYGNYMILPPEEKRVGHHDAYIIDFDKSYTEYMH